MTQSTVADQETARDLLAAIGRAGLAPSVHNTQPWIFHLTRSGIELLSDSSRRLDALDLTGRELTLSCGAALLHLRVALRARGYLPQTALFPEPDREDLIARIDIGVRGRPDAVAVGLDSWADTRQTNRRGYHGLVSDADVGVLQAAAESEGAGLQLITDEQDRISVRVWQQAANAAQISSPAYRRELRSWVNATRRDDGIPVGSTVEPHERSHDLAPRDFAFDQVGGMAEEDDAPDTRLMVLFTEEDTTASWVAAGQGLARLWLEATRLGLVLQPLSQSVEDLPTRLRLRQGLRLSTCWPQLLLRVGRAPAQQGTHRRSVTDITVIDPDVAGVRTADRPARAAMKAHQT